MGKVLGELEDACELVSCTRTVARAVLTLELESKMETSRSDDSLGDARPRVDPACLVGTQGGVGRLCSVSELPQAEP